MCRVKNPKHKDALTEADLTVGRKVTLHFKGGTLELEIASVPFDHRLPLSNADVYTRAIRVYNLTRGRKEETRLLGDLGVTPHSTGKWNDENYVTAR